MLLAVAMGSVMAFSPSVASLNVMTQARRHSGMAMQQDAVGRRAMLVGAGALAFSQQSAAWAANEWANASTQWVPPTSVTLRAGGEAVWSYRLLLAPSVRQKDEAMRQKGEEAALLREELAQLRQRSSRGRRKK